VLNCKSESGKSVSLKLGDSPATKESKYQNLDSEEKDRLKQLVFILDKFCLSDSAYHELSMFFDDMPRKYTVIQCRDDLNSIVHIERLPGNMPGAMLNLNTELERVVKHHISKFPSDVKNIEV